MPRSKKVVKQTIPETLTLDDLRRMAAEGQGLEFELGIALHVVAFATLDAAALLKVIEASPGDRTQVLDDLLSDKLDGDVQGEWETALADQMWHDVTISADGAEVVLDSDIFEEDEDDDEVTSDASS
jgi:hypothetical protein